jgi:hypothetical protein
MPRKRDAVVGNLTAKGFKAVQGDHLFLVYHRQDGLKTPIRTKVSRGTNHRDISDPLLTQMAKQVRLPKRSFLELVDCTLDQAGYEQMVQL